MHRAQPDLIVKAALVGEYGVDKTSIFQRYIYDKLSYQPTIGVDFMPALSTLGIGISRSEVADGAEVLALGVEDLQLIGLPS